MAVFGINNTTELAHQADCAGGRFFFIRCAPQPTLPILQAVDLDVLLSSPCQLCRQRSFVCSEHVCSDVLRPWFSNDDLLVPCDSLI